MKGKFGVPKFDEAKFQECKNMLFARVWHLDMDSDIELMSNLNAYVDQLHTEGMSINRSSQRTSRPTDSRATDEISAGQQVADSLVQKFRRRHAFQVSYDWWRAHKKDDNFEAQRIVVAESNAKHGYLWSKTEVEPAAKVAARDDGLPLEKTVAGALMDKLSWGFETWSSSPTMGRLWEQFSVVFVEGIEGSANAVVLGGVVESSVLTRLEWPHLLRKIDEGSVSGLRVRVMKLAGDPRDSRTWSLETVAGFDVGTQEDFDSLPRPAGPEFWSMQKRWHDRQMAESGKSYDRVDTGESQYSLLNFHKAFDDPTVTVWLSSLEGDRMLTESPKQLSRAATHNLLKRATTMSSLKRSTTMSSVGTSGTSESLRGDSDGDPLSLSTLDLKLAAIQEEVSGESREAEATVNPLVSGAQGYAPHPGTGVSPASTRSAQPHRDIPPPTGRRPSR
ncbi:hypothetical protein [Streptomyces sp. SAI-097]